MLVQDHQISVGTKLFTLISERQDKVYTFSNFLGKTDPNMMTIEEAERFVKSEEDFNGKASLCYVFIISDHFRLYFKRDEATLI